MRFSRITCQRGGESHWLRGCEGERRSLHKCTVTKKGPRTLVSLVLRRRGGEETHRCPRASLVNEWQSDSSLQHGETAAENIPVSSVFFWCYVVAEFPYCSAAAQEALNKSYPQTLGVHAACFLEIACPSVWKISLPASSAVLLFFGLNISFTLTAFDTQKM